MVVKIFFVFVIFYFLTLPFALAHVRLRQPPNRSSIWRNPEFSHFNPQPNYNDDAIYCGRQLQHVDITPATCGVCGDPHWEGAPRDNEDGGKYGRGIVTGTYSSGQVIPISVEFTTAHLGYFEIHICDRVPEYETCFRKLQFENWRWEHPIDTHSSIWVNTKVRLPPGMRCSRCVLRLHYRTGNRWGNCGGGKEGMGCGLQETFRSCSDIRIN